MKFRKSTFLFSLRYKIAIPFVIMVFTIMASVTYIFSIREMAFRSDQVKLRMERLANNIATIRSVGSEDWNFYQSYIENQIAVNPDIVYIAIYNEFHDMKAHVLNTDWLALPGIIIHDQERAHIIGQLEQRYIADESLKDFESVSVNIMMGSQSRGYVHVGFSKVEINDELWRNLITNLGLGFLFTAAAIIVSFYLSQKIVKPLGRLTQAMKRISEGNLNQEIKIESKDELGEMANTFNFMINELKEKEIIESFGRELGFTLEAERIFQLITQRIGIGLRAKKAFLFLRRNKKTCEVILVSAFPEPLKSSTEFRCSPEFHAHIKSNDSPSPLSAFSSFTEFMDGFGLGEPLEPPELICPMKVMDDVVGILVLSGRESGLPYSDSEKSFLMTLLGQAGFALENVLLLHELTEQERLKQELEIARQVQRSLFPRIAPKMKDFDIHGMCLPAAEIGGDYYDYFEIDEDHIGITIADVAGKGTSAAFYMAVVKGLMLSLTKIFLSPKQLFCELNHRLYEIMDRRIFITMIYAVINLKQNTLTFCRAGHNSLLIKDSEACTVDRRIPEGIGLGLESGELFKANIHEESIRLNRNHTILFYTDGITEAKNEQGEEYGEDRLVDLMKSLDLESAIEINEAVVAAVCGYTHQNISHDDMTLVTITAV